MNKAKALAEIAEEIAECKICKEGKTGLPVPGEGNPNADVVFIGEAPGKTEAATGRPFVGRSGKFLRNLINKIGLKEEDVYITSPVKYLPLSGIPSSKDIEHGRIYLMKQLKVIDSKIIVLMGSVAVQAVLLEKLPILKIHGQIIKKESKKYFITLHPAAAIRFQRFRSLIVQDFEKLKKIINNL